LAVPSGPRRNAISPRKVSRTLRQIMGTFQGVRVAPGQAGRPRPDGSWAHLNGAKKSKTHTHTHNPRATHARA